MNEFQWIVVFKNLKTGADVRFEYVRASDVNGAQFEAIKLLVDPEEWFCIMVEKT